MENSPVNASRPTLTPETSPSPQVSSASMAGARRRERLANIRVGGARETTPRARVTPAARALLDALGIDPGIFDARGLPFHPEARGLVAVGLGTDSRDKFLVPGAARAWAAMRDAAAREATLDLLLISAFRSHDYQGLLIRQKLGRGMAIADILTINAPPGGSEHHTGRALDIGVAGCAPLEETFEETDAFRWLAKNAERFGFSMTYPRGNAQGYIYEPWHWCWTDRPPKTA